jgi:hypothetical protein
MYDWFRRRLCVSAFLRVIRWARILGTMLPVIYGMPEVAVGMAGRRCHALRRRSLVAGPRQAVFTAVLSARGLWRLLAGGG